MLRLVLLLLAASAASSAFAASALFEAVQRQDLNAIRGMLANGTPVDAAAMMAADAWSPDAAKLLRSKWRDDGKVPEDPLPAPVVFGMMESLSSRVAARWRDQESRDRVTRIREDLAWMQQRWQAAGEKPSPPAYRTSLMQAAWLFWKAAVTDKASEAKQALAAVAADVAAKVADCRAIPGGLGRVVPIEIRARKNGQDMHGWQVFVKPKLLENVATYDPRPFPKLTSPVAWELPPGVYVAVARKPQSSLKSDPVDITVGSGKKVISWDIPVP